MCGVLSLNVETSIFVSPPFSSFGISQTQKLEKGLTVGLFWANFDSFNSDSAVEWKVMCKEQIFRSKDNAFCL
jgi:hypothetical protein